MLKNRKKIKPVNDGLEEILRKSAHLMSKLGYHGTSMRSLAQETGRSLAGLYHYFKNKEMLLYLINFNGFSAVLGNLQELLPQIEKPEAKIYALIHNHINYFHSHRDEMKVLMWGTLLLSDTHNRQVKRLKEDYNKLGQALVQELYQAQFGRALPVKELSLKTYLLFGMMNWVFTWYSLEKHGTPEEIVKETYAMFLKGMLRNETNQLPKKRDLAIITSMGITGMYSA